MKNPISNSTSGARNSAAFAAVLTTLALLSACASANACPTATVEGKQGSGAASKIGFDCGSGCDRRFYRVRNMGKTTWGTTEVWTRSPHDPGIMDYCRSEIVDVQGQCTIYHTSINPVTCAQSWTMTDEPNGYGRVSYYFARWNNTAHVYDVTSCETEVPGGCDTCGVPPGLIPIISTVTVTVNPCGVSETVTLFEGVSPDDLIYVKSTQVETFDPGYADEYTTDTIVRQARGCAANTLATAPDFSPATRARCASSVSGDRTSAGATLANWRIAITGTVADEKYILHLYWMLVRNGVVSRWVEDRDIGGSDDPLWYYSGETLDPESSTECGFSYEKELLDATIEPASGQCEGGGAGAASGLPRWSPRPGGSGCASCGGDCQNSSGPLDFGTLIRIDLGPDPQVQMRTLGSLVLRAGAPVPGLASPASLVVDHDPASGSAMQIFREAAGALRQILTPYLFVDVTNNNDYQFTIRVMQIAARRDFVNGFYQFDSSTNYLLKEFAVENPDSPTVYNRLRVRDTSNNAEWMFTHSTSLSGWTVNLPQGLGSIELVSTNHGPTAWTIIHRHRNAANQIIAEHSQVFTNFAWGRAMLSDTSGTGTDARIRSWTYYDPPPFSPTSSRLPIQTVLEPDGGWRKVLQYDSQGRVLVELTGIDTGPTDQTSQCRRLVYSYASEDPLNDDLTRSPDNPRREEEYWRDQLIRRVYHVYSRESSQVWYDRTTTCPNPNNLINDSANLVSTIYYDVGTTHVQYSANPDGTILVSTTVTQSEGTTTTTSRGEPNPLVPSQVLNGTVTETVVSPTGTRIFERSWALSQGQLGPLQSSVFYTGHSLETFDRPTRADYLDRTFETMSYTCCGLDTTTDRGGVMRRYEYDALRRAVGHTILSYAWPLSLTNILDSVGRVTATVRNGGGAWPITQQQKFYDTAGRLTGEINALQGPTTYAETVLPGGCRQHVTTNPDGGTITNVYLPSGLLSNVTGTATFPLQYVYGVETEGGLPRFCTKETRLDTLGNTTDEWVKRYQDGLGRVYKSLYSSGAGTPAETKSLASHSETEMHINPQIFVGNRG